MHPQRWNSAFALMGFVGAAALAGARCVAQGVPPPAPAQEVPEALTRGPVHEAYAEPVNLVAQPGLQVQTQPPANIAESPPAAKPQGQNVVWIPGYWSWDTDRNAFIWVSGCWRVAPPNMTWIPGYWRALPGAWEWVPGFWAPAGVQELTYLPEPPACDVATVGVAPAPDYVWVPPCWYWSQTRYILRTGYWLAPHPGWMWVPTHYAWTPRGYVFVEGHWDYPLEMRGVLFAPVCFPQPYYLASSFLFTPSIVISVGLLDLGLFVCPHYSHYYFGDYYDAGYARFGIYPWFEHQHLTTCYSPIYQYQVSQHIVKNPQWVQQRRAEFDQRRADAALRPARTYEALRAQESRLTGVHRREAGLARPLTDVLARPTTTMKFDRIKADQQSRYTRQAAEDTRYSQERTRWEGGRTAAEVQRGREMVPDRRATVTPPAVSREPAIRTPVRPVTPPAVSREPAIRAPERTWNPAPSRDLRMMQPERVQIPSPPAYRMERAPAPAGGRDYAPPSRPSSEGNGRGDAVPQRPDQRSDGSDRGRR